MLFYTQESIVTQQQWAPQLKVVSSISGLHKLLRNWAFCGRYHTLDNPSSSCCNACILCFVLHTCTNKSLLNCRHCRFYAHRIDWRVPICCKLKLAYKISVVCKRTRTSLQKEIGTNIDKLGHLTPQVGHVTATQTAKTSQTRTHMLQLSSTCEHMFIQEIGWKTCFAEHVWSNFLWTVGKKTLTWYFLNGIDTLFYKKIKCYISRTSMINYRVSYFLGEGFVNSSQITHMVILKTE